MHKNHPQRNALGVSLENRKAGKVSLTHRRHIRRFFRGIGLPHFPFSGISIAHSLREASGNMLLKQKTPAQMRR